MTLTPEQFNKLATKDDLNDLAKKVDVDNKFDQVLTAVDGVAKKLDIIETEITSNQVAHDCFEKRISRLETHIGLKPLKV